MSGGPLTLVVLLALARIAQAFPDPGEQYLPLAPNSKWVLRNATQKIPVTFEILAQDNEGAKLRSTTPWSMSEFTLSDRGGKYEMTAYGTGGAMMPLPKKPLYLDFTRPAGTKWSTSLGDFSVVSRSAEVRSRARTYSDCVQIMHKIGKSTFLFTFAKGVGYVQFGDGNLAFVLDESASSLPGSPPPEARPSLPATALFGITPNKFANEALSVSAMTTRFHQTLDAGAGFLVGNGKWAELEPRPGQYSLESVNQIVSAAEEGRLPLSYTLRIVDTIARDVPADLRAKPWSDPALQSRLLGLIDAIAPILKGHVRWFMLGYEIDGYFSKHPEEIQAFTALHRLAAARIKERIPGVAVSSTLMFSGIYDLAESLAPLNSQLDFLALTYCPLTADFKVQDPSVLPPDFRKMKEAAAGRKIVLQEIAYPTAAATGSSEDKQAQFYRLAFDEFSRDPAAFAAVNFMTLADLSDSEAQTYASFYGLPDNAAFKGTLQTLGMFDQQGKPKKSWDLLRRQMPRAAARP